MSIDEITERMDWNRDHRSFFRYTPALNGLSGALIVEILLFLRKSDGVIFKYGIVDRFFSSHRDGIRNWIEIPTVESTV